MCLCARRASAPQVQAAPRHPRRCRQRPLAGGNASQPRPAHSRSSALSHRRSLGTRLTRPLLPPASPQLKRPPPLRDNRSARRDWPPHRALLQGGAPRSLGSARVLVSARPSEGRPACTSASQPTAVPLNSHAEHTFFLDRVL